MDTELEIKKCADDFIYFCENYVKIICPTKGLILFDPYDYQKRYVETIENNKFVICKKFRNGGFTTTALIWSLWNCMFKNDQYFAFISKTDRECVINGNLLKFIIDEFPDWLKPKMDKLNSHSLIFNNSENKIYLINPEEMCSKSPKFTFIEEAAFINYMDKHWKSIHPAIHSKNCVIISTPNGKNWFYETYTNAEQNKNQFKVFECIYLEHPKYCTKEWELEMKPLLGEKGWKQEILCEFLD
jgi:hypothetical protein